TDIARFGVRQTTGHQLATSGYHHGTQFCAAVVGRGIRHSAARRSGYSRCNPARLPAQTPRSVIKAVNNLAGVISNARFSAALVSGTNLTVSRLPAAPWPVMCVTSCGDRSSIGIAEPAWRDQSMVLTGSAT